MFSPINLAQNQRDAVNDYMINSAEYADTDEVIAALLDIGLTKQEADEVIGHRPDFQRNIIFELIPADGDPDEEELERRSMLTAFERSLRA